MAERSESIPRKIDTNSGEAARFLAGKPPPKQEALRETQERLRRAMLAPDTVQTPQAEVHELPVSQPVERRPSAPARAASESAGPSRVGEAGRKTRNMIEKSICLDPDQYRLLRRYANMEGLRLDAQVPVSEVVRHLVDYALAFVKDGEVIPTSDGRGLHVPKGAAK